MPNEMIPIKELPFPQARVLKIVKANLKGKRIISSAAKQELNLQIGGLTENIAKRLDTYPYHTIDVQGIREAMVPYHKISTLNLERERLAKSIMAIKAQCDVLLEELERNYKV